MKWVVSIAFVVAMPLLLIVGTIYQYGTAQPAVPTCVNEEDRVRIRALLLQSVDDALRDHVKSLFNSWLKDPFGQPHRASAGTQAAIVAYQQARADAQKWDPPSC